MHDIQHIAAVTGGVAVAAPKVSNANKQALLEAFVAKNLKKLASEVLIWKRTGRLPENALLTEAAEKYASHFHDAENMVERAIVDVALKHAAK